MATRKKDNTKLIIGIGVIAGVVYFLTRKPVTVPSVPVAQVNNQLSYLNPSPSIDSGSIFSGISNILGNFSGLSSGPADPTPVVSAPAPPTQGMTLDFNT
jgi:hypothetical protein